MISIAFLPPAFRQRACLPALLASVLLTTSSSVRASDPPGSVQTPDANAGPPSAASDAVLVHLAARDGTVLRMRASASDDWRLACVAPCDVPLAGGAQYQVALPGMRPSRPFELRGAAHGRIDLDVAPSRLGLALGLPMLAVGAYGTYGGVRLLRSASEAPESLGKGLGQLIGILCLVGAIPLTIAGALLPFVDTGTHVGQHAPAREDASAPRPRSDVASGRAPDAFVRVPTWSAPRLTGVPRPEPGSPLSFSATF